MQKKIVEILVVTLFIATAVIPAVGIINEKINQTNNTYLQPTVEWVKTYGGDEFDMFRCVQHTSDGGYIAFGEYEEDNNNYARLIKLNSTGDEEWSVINHDINGTGFNQDELMEYVIQTSDGGYLASGYDWYYYIEGDFWNNGGFLWKTDSNGVTEWLKYYYDVDEFVYLVIAQLTEVDDGYIGGGLAVDAVESGPDYDLNFSIVKVDFDGNLLWFEQYDLYGYEYGSSFDITTDGGYFLSGTSSINDIYGDDDDVICIMKADSTGVKQWQQIFNGSKADFCNARGCCQTSDGGYMIVGTTESYGPYGSWDIWQIKTDANGNKEWENFFGEPNYDMTWSMQKTSDGGYIILIDYNQGFVDDILLVKTDEDGNVIWNYLIVQTGRHQPIFIDETIDHGFIICGRTGNPDAKTTDSFLLKVGPFDNQRPSKPTIDGKSKGKPFVNYTFTASSTDPDGDTISNYMWDWGDKNTTLTDQEEVSYSWAKRGTYNIKAKAIDEHGGESEWETFEFNVPRTYNHPFILRLFERFPNLFPILRHLMGL